MSTSVPASYVPLLLTSTHAAVTVPGPVEVTLAPPARKRTLSVKFPVLVTRKEKLTPVCPGTTLLAVVPASGVIVSPETCATVTVTVLDTSPKLLRAVSVYVVFTVGKTDTEVPFTAPTPLSMESTGAGVPVTDHERTDC